MAGPERAARVLADRSKPPLPSIRCATAGRLPRFPRMCSRPAKLAAMGIFAGWIFFRRWFSMAGFGIVLLGAFVPSPNRSIRLAVVALGVAVMLVQLPLIYIDARRRRSSSRTAQPARRG